MSTANESDESAIAGHAMPSHPVARSLASFFSRSLTVFQASDVKFKVVCTVPSPSDQPRRNDVGPSADFKAPTPVPPSRRPEKLVVLDSSFNPPTRAHWRMVKASVDRLATSSDLSQNLRLLLLLSVNNADKAPKPAAFDQRLAMMWGFANDIQSSLSKTRHAGTHSVQVAPSVDLALSTLPYFHEKSTAIAESSFYQPEASSADDMEQVFLVGYDTVIRILNPKYYGPPVPDDMGNTPMQRSLGPLFKRARLHVTLRTDDEWGGREEQTAYINDLLESDGLARAGGSVDWGRRIDLFEGREVGADVISSTFAREAAKHGDLEKLGRMVSPEVLWWVEHEKLYTE